MKAVFQSPSGPFRCREPFSSYHRIDHLHISTAINHLCKDRRIQMEDEMLKFLTQHHVEWYWRYKSMTPLCCNTLGYVSTKKYPFLCLLALNKLLGPDGLLICFQFLLFSSLVPNGFSARHLLPEIYLEKHLHAYENIPRAYCTFQTLKWDIMLLLKVFLCCCNSISFFFFLSNCWHFV